MKIVIIGATSAIVKEVARLYCNQGPHFVLVGRSEKRLLPLKADLLARGAGDVKVEELAFDNYKQHQVFAENCFESEKVHLLIIAHGQLPIQEEVQDDFVKLKSFMDANYTSYLSFLSSFSSLFEKQKSGRIAVFTSVAGDRGRKSNYVYGSFKAGIQTYLEGLRARISANGVSVLDIRPGLIDTPMTAHLTKNFLFASPDIAAKDIVKAINKGTTVLYTPFFWRYIMLIIKNIPRFIFNKMNL